MTVTALTNGMFDVTSERDETVSYVVAPGKSCTCPHFQVRLIGTGKSCKHQVAAEQFAASQPAPTALERAATVAQTLSDADLKRYAAERIGSSAGCACLLELAARAAAAQPKPIPAGVMELLQGATDKERARALAVYS